jgi:hypothetical protein
VEDIMIDLETLDLGPQSAVIAVGAVMFDPMTGHTGAEFYAKIRPDDAMLYGTHTQDTLEWWGRQDPAARAEAFGGVISSWVICDAFRGFVLGNGPGVRPWGNGATFDVSILEHLFKVHGLPAPWDFWDVRDVRTVVDMGERLRGCQAKKMPFQGMAHKALDDARHQARYVTEIFQQLRVEP